jgi:hypothetical protein
MPVNVPHVTPPSEPLELVEVAVLHTQFAIACFAEKTQLSPERNGESFLKLGCPKWLSKVVAWWREEALSHLSEGNKH